jgi:hypothetical protein
VDARLRVRGIAGLRIADRQRDAHHHERQHQLANVDDRRRKPPTGSAASTEASRAKRSPALMIRAMRFAACQLPYAQDTDRALSLIDFSCQECSTARRRPGLLSRVLSPRLRRDCGARGKHGARAGVLRFPTEYFAAWRASRRSSCLG